MEIRYITKSDDMRAVSKVYEESWKYAYRGIVPQGYLDSIPEGQWASHIEQADRKNLVMVQDGIIIGTSGFGRARMEEMNGFGKVFLWVLEENQNARHFYEKCGFVQTERCLYSDIGGRELKEVQYCYQNT